MPELPEVETIRTELLPYVLGRTITGVDLFWERIVRQPSVEEFTSRIVGRKINGISRRGKYLFFHLNAGGVLVMHMKMTGSLIINPSDDRFTRAVLHLDNGTALHFWDPRKFGVMWLDEDDSAVLAKLGPEPLDDDFTPEVLAEILRNRTAPVKPVILDQSIIAGIGNMYADESLFDARINPTRPAGSLSDDEVRRLHASIRRVLLKALKEKGASIRNYIRPDGSPGTAHDEFNVAHGVGKDCPRCGTPVRRIVVRGRGTYFCPKCQPEG
ncbi:MAG: bifunctional DNA-formamidopyrimidine glycosylase/DNA-(apurinic or apyrimidinic site) lyase [Dehalococcoidales bacterium]|nr:bifunctional DNA-formamidopyrimidine glycosylase/DNA-(apurinic or apyrimidinic site) lyase [Dehalococcoidales bacterium]